MKPTEDLLTEWKKFDSLPMETLTKAWYYHSPIELKQRSVQLMIAHHEQYGVSGNCFDLAIWLIHEFANQGIRAYAVGHDLFTPNAHVAVVALNQDGYRYFCDLGDQWIQPILVDRNSKEYCEDVLDSFFPGARVQVSNQNDKLYIKYFRPNGKISSQHFDLTPTSHEELLSAGEHSQRLLRHPLVEKRIFAGHEVHHWEFDDGKSFLSTNEQRVYESELIENDEWADRISERTGMDKEVVKAALDVYKNMKG